MSDYRLYFLSHDGRIARAVDLSCTDDEHAIRTVADHVDGRAMELWHRDRRVKSFDSSNRG